MCSKSKVNEALQQGVSIGSNSPSMMQIPSISAHQVRQDRTKYLLVDVREELERQEAPLDNADVQMTLGAICRDASDLVAKAKEANSLTIVLVCGNGARSQMAAECILTQTSSTTQVAVLQRGMIGWDNISAVVPDFLVILGQGESTEKLSLSLAACATAVEMHPTVVLVLMSDGVNWFLRADSPKLVVKTNHVESVSHGEPFKPCKAMLQKFLSQGGVILVCSSCVKHRGYSFETDMMECVNPMQMPDLVRMMGEAKGGCLQFM